MAIRPRATSVPQETWGIVLKAITDFANVDKNQAWDCCNDVLSYSGNFIVPSASTGPPKAAPVIAHDQAVTEIKALAEGKNMAGLDWASWLAIVKLILDILSKIPQGG